MPEKKVRVCVVGMGIGKPNGRALAKNDRGEVVALCDLIPERMEEFARELPGEQKFYTDYKEMCKDPNIDAVFVGTPKPVACARRTRSRQKRQTRHGHQTAIGL